MRTTMFTIERALILTGIILAGSAATFATVMMTDPNHVPVFPGSEHLMIFAQPATRAHGKPLVGNAPMVATSAPILVDPMPIGSLPEAPPTEAPPAAREKALPGFFVRGIYGGKAMVQTADGFVMVEPGKVIPGAGEVSRIERRGQEWVVVTTHGVIGQTPN